MNLTKVEKLENHIVELEVKVGEDEFEPALEKAYHKNAGQITIQGFRKGKAPRKMIERVYGESIFFEDAVNFAYPDAYRDAVEAADVEPIEQADVNITEISPKGFTFTAKVAVVPEVTLKEYKGLSAVKQTPEVSDKDIEDEVERLRSRNARIETVDRPAKLGDTVVLDFEGFVDDVAFEGGKGDNFSLELGSGQFIPGFEDQLVGAKAGDKLDVTVTFPEDYNASELAGKEAVFKCVVHEVKEKSLPEIDDELAKDVSEFDTLEEMKADISSKMLERRTADAEREFEEVLLSKLIDGMEADVPDAMVENQIDRVLEDMNYRLSMQGMNLQSYVQMTGMTMEQMRENYREGALRQVKISLALAKVAQSEGITISDEEVEKEYQRLSEQNNMPIERIKSIVEPRSIKKDMKTDRAVKLIKDSAVIEKEKKSAKKKASPAKTTVKKSAADEKDVKAEEKATEKTTAEKKKAPAKKAAAKKSTDAKKED